MSSSVLADLDLIEEVRLRRWARENFVPANQRNTTWHPIVLDEMDRKDGDMRAADVSLLLTTQA
ncbi:MAG: hypothetical protein U0746_13230 [Gemmataceae bacterium]